MKTHAQSFGELGELLAKKFLESQGAVFLISNYKTRYGEIDLICRQRGQIIFVEVKTRRQGNRVNRSFHIHPQKLARIEAAAMEWLAENHEEEHRFLLVEVILEQKQARIRCIPLAEE